ncbi:hypothetical protein BDZ89DRAFT_1137126 [Hymenopellis radicata]|nr:hypothetical protein BDZ89DRAFT_1137126 [Hymenopellis radicata]
MVFIFQIFLGIGYLPIISPRYFHSSWHVDIAVALPRGNQHERAAPPSPASATGCASSPAIQNINWRVFIIFAVFNACWFFPETRGLEIDHIFEKGEAIEAEMREDKGKEDV